jgi:hypothetical protein
MKNTKTVNRIKNIPKLKSIIDVEIEFIAVRELCPVRYTFNTSFHAIFEKERYPANISTFGIIETRAITNEDIAIVAFDNTQCKKCKYKFQTSLNMFFSNENMVSFYKKLILHILLCFPYL